MDKKENSRNAELELKHIELEMRARRFRHLRHFIDPYYCYTNDIVRPSGAINTDDVMWREYVSVEARRLQEITTDARELRKLVRREHLIPLRHIKQLLREIAESDSFTLDDIGQCLDSNLHFATITREEDKKLNKLRLGQKMPEGYSQIGHDLYNDKFARYRIAGIKLT